jgi:HK97 family phage prohead protease
MNETAKKFSSDVARELKSALERQETDEVIAKTEADKEGQEFTFVVSTSALDRQGDELDQSKWDFANFKKNPVILWAHDYYSPPIGICTEIKTEGEQTVATVKFAPEAANPFAAQVSALVKEGYINATSVGYIEHDDGTYELLEISIVPVPANAQALSVREAEKMGLNLPQLVMKGINFVTKGAIPYKDHGKADPDTSWDGPKEVKECGEDFTKLKAICAWYDAENPDVKSSYKLPHHQASDLKAVWNGVKAAMGALLGARGGTKIPEKDKHAVYSHLAKHYKEFDKEAPEFEKALELAAQHLNGETVEGKYLDLVSGIEKAERVGDRCELDDGTPGVLAEDPDNPGKLVCVPPDGDKSKKAGDNDGDEDDLATAFKAEHKRHGEAVAKAIDEFSEKGLSEDGSAKPDTSKAIDEFEEKMESEHAEHLEKTLKAIDENYELQDQAKSIDEFKKAVNGEHEKHVKAFDKAIDEFKDAWGDGDDSDRRKAIDDFTKRAQEELGRHEKAHEELLKAETDKDDEKKAIALIARKIGREISARNKEKIKAIIKSVEDHKAAHGKAMDDVIAALKDFIGPDAGSEGEEPGGKTAVAPKPKVEVRDIRAGDDTFEAFMTTRRVLRTFDKAVDKALEDLNQKFREHFPNRR